ncbi:unnamed protein product [Symbiodinium sp. CCMP2592]|nr:unnamed protein product [Symbiodinium sp. CCMP2592]
MAAATWSVTAITMAGESFEIPDLSGEDTLPSLTCKVEAALGLEVDAQRRVTLLHEHCPLAGTKRLAELGVQPGTELLCVMRRAAFVVHEGMKVHVMAGTASVVGSYIARPNKSGTMTFHHTSRENQRIAWYPKQETTTVKYHSLDDPDHVYREAKASWPAGWYFEGRPVRSARGIYFQPSYSHRCLPLEGWQVYFAPTFCDPGNPPMPEITVVEDD